MSSSLQLSDSLTRRSESPATPPADAAPQSILLPEDLQASGATVRREQLKSAVANPGRTQGQPSGRNQNSSTPLGTIGEWRLFTQREFHQAIAGLSPGNKVTLGAGAHGEAESGHSEGHIHASEEELAQAVKSLEKHVGAIGFEHGCEGKIPRANTWRPYRLTCQDAVAAIVVLRASEAFNVCEIDVFLTAELPGLPSLEATRAALLLAFSDAAKNGGSMAIQFSQSVFPDGVPRHVVMLASRYGVTLHNAERGTLSPMEVRNLFLKICGLTKDARKRVVDGMKRGFFSAERVCQLVSRGFWTALEANCVLLSSPYPELVFGTCAVASSRHLSAHGLIHTSAALLTGLFDRALCYRPPTSPDDKHLTERSEYLRIPSRLDGSNVAVTHGPMPQNARLPGWSIDDDRPVAFRKGTSATALIRPRQCEEIRTFLIQDLEQLCELARRMSDQSSSVLVYPSDFRQLSAEERREADQAARKRKITILSSPVSAADLDADAWRRIQTGRTVRQ